MQPAAEWISEKLQRPTIPNRHWYFTWQGIGTIGQDFEGNLLFQDNEGLCIAVHKQLNAKQKRNILRQIVQDYGQDYQISSAERFWLDYLGKENQILNATMGLLVNTMHKRKGVKVEPIDQSGQDTRPITGYPDWKSRAKQKQKPQEHRTLLDKSFEPRYVSFPRGTRMTPDRIKSMKISPMLTSAERGLLLEMLYRREGALAWDFSESGRISHEVIPPVTIDTIPHQAWQVPQFPIAKKLRETVIEMIQQRIDRGVLELCKSQYRNPWFLVAKKDAGYRVINNAQRYNGVTIRDANPPPNPDDLAEEFAGCHIMSLMDFFSGYDQVELDIRSRDITAFATPLGLVRQCTLPQGATNSVAEFVRVMTKICRDHIPHRCIPYLDDVCVKGPKSDYNDEVSEMPGVRRFVFEHLVNLDTVLADIERAGATISGHKSEFGYPSMIIVGYRVDKHGRHPSEQKVSKIMDWPECRNVVEVRGFVGVVTYYRVWIEDFAIVAAPLFCLLRKDVVFVWEQPQAQAMKSLKLALCSPPALVSIDYTLPLRKIVLAVDGSMIGWGAVIMQEDTKGRRHPIRFESGVWSKPEQKWESNKHECKALLLAIRKFRAYLYNVHFTVETDCKTLIAQLRRSATDLPGALMTRWLAYLAMWDFDIVHVSGKKNAVADGLSRMPQPEGWEPPETSLEDDFIDLELNFTRLEFEQDTGDISLVSSTEQILEDGYSDESQELAQWIVNRRMPEHLSKGDITKFKRNALRYIVQDRYLFQVPTANRPLRRVIDDQNQRQEILKALHEESGHRGREGTWRKAWTRYYWKGLYDDVKRHCKTCPQCQIHADAQSQEPLHPTEPLSQPWGWVTIDVVYMPLSKGNKQFMVVARDYLSQWPEAKALAKNDSGSVAKFIKEDIFCRWGVPLKMGCDGGPENRGLVEDLQRTFGIQRVVSSAYHPQGQGLIERGHKVLVAALKKLSGHWTENLSSVLWADRVTTKRTTGETPAYLLCGKEHVLPIELSIPTWRTLPWETVTDTASLLELRALQFQKRDERLKEAVDRTTRMRDNSKELFDQANKTRTTPLAPQDLVLLRDTFSDGDMSRLAKFRPKWRGPFRIKIVHAKGYYQVEELDGTPLGGTIAGDRLKIFYPRDKTISQRVDQERPGRGSNAEPPIEQPQNGYEQDIPQAPTRKAIEVRIPLKPNIERSAYRKFD